MKLLSVNVAMPEDIPYYQGRTIRTAINKKPVQGQVKLKEYGLKGDGQADLEAHGGIYQAVYVYPMEHYMYWSQLLQRDDFTFGQFGENFTVEGLLESEVFIGDVFKIGHAAVEVTQPRIPCYKLEYKMGVEGFTKMFHESKRIGFYLRVLEKGKVGAGDTIERVKRGKKKITVDDIYHLRFFDRDNYPALKQAAKLPALSPEWRDVFAKMAEKEKKD